jgi:osmotically-inducible protein OsmY
VIARLEDDPRIVDSAEIAVAGDGGIVTLRGTVDRFSQRRAAENDARGVPERRCLRRRVEAVWRQGVTNEIKVTNPS